MIRASNVTPHPLRTWAGALKAFWPVGLCLLLMLPRLASPQFGLLDDGATLSVARRAAQGDWAPLWEGAAGRSRPIYWFFYLVVFLLAGPRPLWFFAAQTCLFAACTGAIVLIVQGWGGSKRQACVSAVLFALSGPIVENVYTLSKPELLQLGWILLSMLIVTRGSRAATPRTGLMTSSLGGAALLLANLTKETGLVMIPISLAWFLLVRIQHFHACTPRVRNATTMYLLSSVIAGLVFIGMRSALAASAIPQGVHASNYELSWTRLVSSSVRWSAWILRDWSYLLPPAAIVGVLWGIGRRPPQVNAVVGAILWTAGWLAVYLPWAFVVEYYLLPVGAGGAVLGGLVLEEVMKTLRGSGKLAKAAAAASVVLSLALFAVLIVDNISNARLQLAVDAANAEMLDAAAARLPPGGTLLVNLPKESEYVAQIGLHLVARNRADVTVGSFSSEAAELRTSDLNDHYIVTPLIENQFLLSVRMGVFETQARERDQQLHELLGERIVRIYKVERRFRFLNIDLLGLAMNSSLARSICERFRYEKYCGSMAPVIDTRTLVYGWEVYKLLPGEG